MNLEVIIKVLSIKAHLVIFCQMAYFNLGHVKNSLQLSKIESHSLGKLLH